MGAENESEMEHFCPFCGGDDYLIMEDELLRYVMCLYCRACGPCGDSVEEAHLHWISRADSDDAEFLNDERRNNLI